MYFTSSEGGEHSDAVDEKGKVFSHAVDVQSTSRNSSDHPVSSKAEEGRKKLCRGESSFSSIFGL